MPTATPRQPAHPQIAPSRPLGVLNHDPLVIYATVESFLPLPSTLLDAIAGAAQRPFTLVVQIERALRHLATEQPSLLEHIGTAAQRHERAHPRDRVWLACGSAADLAIAEQRGLKAALLYKHAFLNDAPFAPKPQVPKQYDALLIAPSRRRERHGLASLVEGLAEAPLPAPSGPAAPVELPRAAIRSLLPHACSLNPPAQNADLATLIGRSRVGLFLGDHDDPSAVPLQCWLSGVPVVMTAGPAAGEPMYEPTRALPCADTPAAVADAVSIALARDFDPVALRRGVLTRLWTCRNDWRAFVAKACTAMGHADGNRFEDQFKALRPFDTAANLRNVAALKRVLAAGTGVADPANPAAPPKRPRQ